LKQKDTIRYRLTNGYCKNKTLFLSCGAISYAIFWPESTKLDKQSMMMKLT